MRYEVLYSKRAEKALSRLYDPLYSRMKAAIDSLAADPRPPGSLKLTGADAYRIRVGDYRIIYEIVDAALQVLVIDIGHRKDIYG